MEGYKHLSEIKTVLRTFRAYKLIRDVVRKVTATIQVAWESVIRK